MTLFGKKRSLENVKAIAAIVLAAAAMVFVADYVGHVLAWARMGLL